MNLKYPHVVTGYCVGQHKLGTLSLSHLVFSVVITQGFITYQDNMTDFNIMPSWKIFSRKLKLLKKSLFILQMDDILHITYNSFKNASSKLVRCWCAELGGKAFNLTGALIPQL